MICHIRLHFSRNVLQLDISTSVVRPILQIILLNRLLYKRPWHVKFTEIKQHVARFVLRRVNLFIHYVLLVFLKPSEFQSCLVHPHSIEINLEGLKRDSGSCDLLSSLETQKYFLGLCSDEINSIIYLKFHLREIHIFLILNIFLLTKSYKRFSQFVYLYDLQELKRFCLSYDL